ncbi:MAG: NAD-dependent epimerase/dehydratase family protein [Gammaproteobacteria bacterium]|nr:NAD-dependent epimerase/dehydratase family protein [Gammaproteobacteria bacterium]
MNILVTGGGGFLGGAIVRLLVERGDTVRSFSRNEYPELAALGVEQHRGDLADAEAVARATKACDLVFHAAAKPGAWGPYQAYYNANVLGTQYVLNACRQQKIRYLVYTSSPSVVFTGCDMEGVNESAPYPAHHQAHYPKTKAEAERKVLAANEAELRTTALRPHLIWGPRDPNLVARIVTRGRAGQLLRIGREPKLVDTVYIDDAARAHLLAADRLRETPSKPAGKAYFISSGRPIDVWEMVDRILAAADLPPLKRSISPKAAYAAGWLLETVYGLLRIKSEPRMTRWVAEQLSNAHWFDITAARRDLGYEPQVSLDKGLFYLKAWLAETSF